MALLGTYVPYVVKDVDTNDLTFPVGGPAEWCPACAQSQIGVRSAARGAFTHCNVRDHENQARRCAGLTPLCGLETCRKEAAAAFDGVDLEPGESLRFCHHHLLEKRLGRSLTQDEYEAEMKKLHTARRQELDQKRAQYLAKLEEERIVAQEPPGNWDSIRIPHPRKRL